MWSRKHRDPRVADELRFHRDRLIEGYLAKGMSRQEAERRAFLEFGNVPQIEEAVRDVRGRWLDDLANDLRYATRTLRRTPGFTAVAVLSFALGIGANAAIFTLINAVMLRTLPVKDPSRLVQITRLLDGRPGVVSFPLFEHFRDNVKSISGAFAQVIASQPIVIDGEEEVVSTDLVSGSYYALLGLEPAAGRLLTSADDVVSPAAPAAVISDRYWQRRFGRSPSAIGKSLTINDRLFTIVGVTPSWYDSATAGHIPDLTLPLMMKTATGPQYRSTDFNWLNILARLKPGATVEEANAEVQVLFAAFVQAQSSQAPEKERANILRQRAVALPAPDGFNPFRDNVRRPLLVLMGIVALILMLACVNLSGLLLARAAARQREISIRLAMGAGRGRVVRQFITESLVLASIGGAAGLAVAGWLSVRLYTLFVNGRDVVFSLTPDWRVLAFTGLASLVACIVSGLAPALQAVRVNLNPALKEVRAQGHGRLGRALVVAQLTISMILIVGAALFVGTFLNLNAADRGFDSDGILLVSVRHSRPYSAAGAAAVRSAVLERLRALPGVQSASAAWVLPASGVLLDRNVRVEGYTFGPDESESVGFNVVAPAYFAALGTPLAAGREFTDNDTDTSPQVAIVNESFARHFFQDQSALGRRVTSVGATYEIVGVARDAKYQKLRDGMIRTMYVPWTQRPGIGGVRPADQPMIYNYFLRVAVGDPMRLAPGLDRLVREADPALHVRTTMAYDTVIGRTLSTERIMATLGGFFGLLALVVAALGVFGVLAFQVARRTNELGVRIALGASRQAMTRFVLRDVGRMLILGVTFGTVGALMATGVTRSMLFGLSPTEPAVFLAAALVLASAALVAGWLPARRAARIDPVVALRHE
jgi:putative ABC transport system permease protein